MSDFETVVEEAAIGILRELGYAYHRGSDLADERKSTADVILEGRFRQALARLNPHLGPDALDDVARRILQPPTASVAENNRFFHRALSVAQVEAALAYAEENEEEIEEDLARRAKEVEELHAEFGQPPIVERLRKQRHRSHALPWPLPRRRLRPPGPSDHR